MSNEASDDPDLKRLNAKTKKGAINVVSEVLDDPQVRAIIKNAILPETVRGSIIMACLMIGLLKLYDVAKTLIGFNWVGDSVISVTLITIGLIYLLPALIRSKING
ncbi:hypothetical protein MUP77_15625 [Candidatus Bathyarchaeota archaeon]|nr:hypothetical protein [Candidatus Bathyarchaeota archaeon]